MNNDAAHLRNHPMFTEMDERAERDDEWSYPKGLAFCGMVALAESEPRHFADQYFEAAEAIVDLVLRNQVADYTVQNPILFLYRHAIELYLKVILDARAIPYEKKHSLHVLLNKVDGIAPWAGKRVLEIHAIDPGSTLLRYGGDKTFSDYGEAWVELTFVRDAMRALRDHLVGLIDGVTVPVCRS